MQLTAPHLDKAEDLGGFFDRQKLVHFEMEPFRYAAQVGLAVER